MTTLDCVIAFSFGFRCRRGTTTPGPSNEDLAAFAADHYRSLPKIMQFEVADAYSLLEPDEPVTRIERNHRRPGAYLDTRNVAEQASLQMIRHGWHSAAIVAHPLHVQRSRLVCERLGIVTDGQQIEAMKAASIRFDTESAQRWTRSPAAYRPHELLARTTYKLLRYT